LNLVSAGLLLFWGIYFAMAGTGNIVDWLTNHGYRGRYFRLSSKNLELLERVAKKHGSGASVIKFLFAIIASLELLAALTYVSSFVLYILGNTILLPFGFIVGMSLFAGLILGNEAFVYYDDEEEHVIMLLAQLVSYIAVVTL
jgi:fatty acid desaturase